MNAVLIVPYDPGWPSRFEAERAVLGAVFAGCDAVIEHIGSTAVPGLAAKPVIDVLVGLPALAEAERRIPALDAAGYEYVPEHEAALPDRRYFRKPRVGPRACHVHCVVHGSESWERHLAFRDHLRSHPASAAAYEDLKRHLAARLAKWEYAEAKGPFIERILAGVERRPPCSAPQLRRRATGPVRPVAD
jgi:GrpB-like predicted nucleotidyltransferase (UPF0157 family)